jgi:uncharacterized protein GlcG (DUF336 family)
MERVVWLCTSLQQLDDISSAAFSKARNAQLNVDVDVAQSAKESEVFADDASTAATIACEAAQEAAHLATKIAREMKDAEQAANAGALCWGKRLLFQRLKLQYDGPVLNFAFNFNLRRYTTAAHLMERLHPVKQGLTLVHFSAQPEPLLSCKPPDLSHKKRLR